MEAAQLIWLCAALGGALAGMLAVVRPELGLPVLALLWYNPTGLFIRANLSVGSYIATWSFAAGAGAGIAILWAARRWSIPWHLAKIWSPYLGVLMIAAVAGAASGNPIPYVVTDFSQYSEMAVFALIVASLLANHGTTIRTVATVFAVMVATFLVEILIVVLAGTGVLTGLSGVWGVFVPDVGEIDLLRPPAVVPAALLPICLAALLHRPSRRTPASRALVWVGLALFTIGVVASLKRSLWVGAAFGMVLVFVQLWRDIPRRQIVRLVAGLAVFGIVMGVISAAPIFSGATATELVTGRLKHALVQFEDEENIGRVSRLYEYSVVRDVIADRPILGTGLGGFYFGYRRGDLADKHFFHNSLLGLGYRTGVAGLLAFTVALGGTMVWSLRRSRDTPPEAVVRYLVPGLVASIAVLVAASMTSGVLFTHPYAGLIGGMAGVMHQLVSAGPRVGREST
jgi:hypothetical protein